MKPAAVPRDDPFPVNLLPFFTIVAAAVVTAMPLRIPIYLAVTPGFTLMTIYHWILYRPTLVPPVVLFAAGLLVDLLTDAPLGVSSLVFLLVRASLMGRRHFFIGRLFPFVWAGFAIVAALAIALIWAIGGALHTTFLDPRVTALQWVLTVALFPAASWLLARIQRAFLAAF
jgi:rod shape-determining protein MreD